MDFVGVGDATSYPEIATEEGTQLVGGRRYSRHRCDVVSIVLALVLASALVADAQTTVEFTASEQWRRTTVYEKLGVRLVTPEEIMASGLAIYTPEQIKLLFEKRPSPGRFDFPGKLALNAMRDHGYVMVPVPPAAIGKSEEPWLPVRLLPIPESFNQDWKEQEKLASGHKRPPTVDELTWFAQVLWAVRRELPFQTVYVRTSNVSLDGGHVCLGENQAGVLKIKTYADSFKSEDLGMAPVAQR
jgi:hypothetical protein